MLDVRGERLDEHVDHLLDPRLLAVQARVHHVSVTTDDDDDARAQSYMYVSRQMMMVMVMMMITIDR